MNEMLRDPETLHPLLLPIYFEHMRRMRSAGLIPVPYFFWRSKKAQDLLYESGRTMPGRLLTYARGGQSWHNVERFGLPASLAYDLILVAVGGRDALPDDDAAWTIAGELGEGLGLTWGGRRRSLDMGHYQLDDRGELSLSRAMAGEDPKQEQQGGK